jgi:phosphatidylinositol-3-phosphatase
LLSRLLVAGALMVIVAQSASAATRAPADPGVPRVAHVVLVVFENKERDSVLGSGAAPTFDSLAARYAQATSYDAVSHPSLPNYLALVSGSTHGVTSDCTDCMQSGPTLGTQLSASGRPWGAFAEDYPDGPGFAKKHVPFLYFPGGAAHVRPLQDFDPGHLPAFAMVTPNLCHDMHDCPVASGDAWLRHFIRPLLRAKDTAIFITFDEGSSDAGGGGHVPLIVAGTAVKAHAVATRPTSHYGLLRTIEDLLGLGRLGQARSAQPVAGIWAASRR